MLGLLDLVESVGERGHIAPRGADVGPDRDHTHRQGAGRTDTGDLDLLPVDRQRFARLGHLPSMVEQIGALREGLREREAHERLHRGRDDGLDRVVGRDDLHVGDGPGVITYRAQEDERIRQGIEHRPRVPVQGRHLSCHYPNSCRTGEIVRE